MIITAAKLIFSKVFKLKSLMKKLNESDSFRFRLLYDSAFLLTADAFRSSRSNGLTVVSAKKFRFKKVFKETACKTLVPF